MQIQPDFLRLDETRGVRLQLEYLEVELALKRHRIRETITIFGSTRTLPGTRYYEEAWRLGGVVARAGSAVLTGGGPGIMEAANRGAFEAGGSSIGMNITLPGGQPSNSYLTPGLSFRFRYFALRKLHFLLRARALVAFPGGYGTFDELFETLMLVQTRKIKPLPVVLVGEAYWRRAFDAEFLVSEGMLEPGDAALFSYANSAEEAWAQIVAWERTASLPHVSTGKPVTADA
jgi:uncharacterized protein (TIGR00730 family)